jgi:uncharacterized SAM-binding protein YcdF (DUF218 family)
VVRRHGAQAGIVGQGQLALEVKTTVPRPTHTDLLRRVVSRNQQHMQPRSVIYTVVPIAVILLAATLYLARERILLSIGDLLVVQDVLQPADVVHVISGPDHRTDYGIQLYKQGYGKQIFFTGDWCSLIQGNHAQRAKERAIEQGISPQAISTDGTWVTSTYSESVKLREFIADSVSLTQSVIIVSDPHHMRRARWTYRRVLGNRISVQMAPVPFELSPYKRRWWTDEESRHMVWNEYRKIAYYYARYQFSWGLVREWLASLDRG